MSREASNLRKNLVSAQYEGDWRNVVNWQDLRFHTAVQFHCNCERRTLNDIISLKGVTNFQLATIIQELKLNDLPPEHPQYSGKMLDWMVAPSSLEK